MPSMSPWPTPSTRSRPRTPAAGSSTAATLSPPIDPQSALVVAEPGAIEKLPHGFRLASREVVHHQHVIGFDLAQRGQEHLVEKGVKHRPVGRGPDAHGGDEPSVPSVPSTV